MAVDYEPLPAVADYAAAGIVARRWSTRPIPGNLAGQLGGAPGGDARRRLRRRAHVVAETIWQQAYAAVPMETRGLVAEWSGAAS